MLRGGDPPALPFLFAESICRERHGSRGGLCQRGFLSHGPPLAGSRHESPARDGRGLAERRPGGYGVECHDGVEDVCFHKPSVAPCGVTSQPFMASNGGPLDAPLLK